MAALYNFGQPNIVTLSVFGLPNTLLLPKSIKKDIKYKEVKKLKSKIQENVSIMLNHLP